MTITVAIKLNGGAAGAPLSVAAGAAVTATLDSVAGVNSVAWSIASGDDLVAPGDYTLVTSGVKGETCDTNASATQGTAAIIQAVVNGDPTLYARAKFYVLAANGMETGADGELYEGDATHGTARISNEAIRASGSGSYAPANRLITTTTPLLIDGGASADLSANRTLSLPASSGAANGYMSSAHYTLVNGATSTATNATIVKWGAAKDIEVAYLKDANFAGTLANTGVVRTGDGPTVLMGGHAVSGTANRRLVAWDAGELKLGVDADTVDVDGADAAALGAGGTRVVWATGRGLQLFSGGSEDFAGGDGVLGITEPTTEPTTVPGAGNIVAWTKSGGLKTKGPKGLVYSATADGTGVQTLSIADVIWWSTQTTDASTTAVNTYATAVPAGGQCALELWVIGIQSGSDLRVAYKVLCAGGRAPAGSLVIDATSVTTVIDNIGCAAVPTVDVLSNATRVNVRGKGATTINWVVEGTIRLWKP